MSTTTKSVATPARRRRRLAKMSAVVAMGIASIVGAVHTPAEAAAPALTSYLYSNTGGSHLRTGPATYYTSKYYAPNYFRVAMVCWIDNQ